MIFRYILLFVLPFILFLSCGNEPNKEVKQAPSTVVKPKIVKANIQYGFNFNLYDVDTGRVQKNEGLTHILPKYGINSTTIFNIANQFDSVFDVRKIKPKHLYTALKSKDSTKKLEKFIYQKDPINYVVFDFKDSLNVYTQKKPVLVKEKQAAGVVTSSLWNAFIDKGLSPALVGKVTSLYAWSIDFFGIQKGDYFKVIYEAKYVDDKFIGVGKIKSVLFNHMDNSKYFFAYKNDTMPASSYYSELGESMKRALLSAPLVFKRISSRFSNRRFHPVLKYYRPHHGVDYAAPTGTEVVATGNGIVTYAGWAGQAGRLVKIKHSTGNIVTKYMHLSKFGKGIKKGARVNQGQKIGEVGSTGASTGPHLDYRIFIKGKAVDPLGIDIPTVAPLKDSALIEYKAFVAPLKINLDNIPLDTTVVL